MKMIVISEEAFDKLFDETLKNLELDKLRKENYTSVSELHRKFHYEVCCLKNKIAEE